MADSACHNNSFVLFETSPGALRVSYIGISFVDLVSFGILLLEKDGLKWASSTWTDFSWGRPHFPEKILVPWTKIFRTKIPVTEPFRDRSQNRFLKRPRDRSRDRSLEHSWEREYTFQWSYFNPNIATRSWGRGMIQPTQTAYFCRVWRSIVASVAVATSQHHGRFNNDRHWHHYRVMYHINYCI